MAFLSGLNPQDAFAGLFGAARPSWTPPINGGPSNDKPQGRGGVRGFLGGLLGGGGGLPIERLMVAQAFSQGDYGGAATIISRQRALEAEQRQAQAELQAEQDARNRQLEAASMLTGPGGQARFSKQQLNSLTGDDLSQLVRETYQPRQFGSEGGSVRNVDPSGAVTYDNAPRSYSDEGRLFQIDPQGNPNQILDARAGDIDWQTIPGVGAFSTDRTGRPTVPGANLQSPMGAPQQAPQAPGADPTAAADPNGVFGRMIQQESGGRQFGPNGQPLRSSAGAIGIAQVMPGTAPEAARLAGLPFDRQRYMNDPEYNAALGRAYFQEQLRQFGDPAQAVAAYNAGPQRVRIAVRQGGDNWISRLPRETQDYVATVMGAGGTQFAQAGQGRPGSGRSLQEQAMSGVIMAPPDRPPAQTEAQRRRDEAQATIAERDASMSPAQEAVDREYAERYVEWRTNEWSDVRRNLEQVRDAIRNVQTYNVTGRVLGRLPDFMVDDRVVDTREQVEEVVQRNLRAILGAQFTAQEGERLISRAYNPRLDESVNATRLNRLLAQMAAAAQSNESAARYYEENGTLRGWRGRIWTINDFDPERADPREGQRRQAAPRSDARPNGRTRQGVRWRVVGQ